MRLPEEKTIAAPPLRRVGERKVRTSQERDTSEMLEAVRLWKVQQKINRAQ